MAEFIKVDGKNVGDIKVYTLSTCGWCKKTKTLFNKSGIAYSYVDVDTLSSKDVEVIKAEQKKFNPECSYPTIVVNNSDCIIGYNEDKLLNLIGE